MKPESSRIKPSSLCTRKSTIPGAGKGLFAKEFIGKDQLIIEYKGEITTYKKVQEYAVMSTYVYYVNENHVIDARAFPENLGRYANDADGIASFPGITNNAKFVVLNKRVYLKAIANILPGSEILAAYGKPYWDIIRANKALEKKKTSW